MNPEALTILDQVLPHQTFSTLQETIFCYVWEGKTYAEIARLCDYDHSYIRDVGFRLWHLLSDALGETVSKRNMRSVLSRQVRLKARVTPLATTRQTERFIPAAHLVYPSGPVPLNSKFYIDRPPLETQAYDEIARPGGLVKIRAPRQMGKTSLLRRIIHQAQGQRMLTVNINLCRADRSVFSSLERFLRWLFANISRQLELSCKLDDYWDMALGCKVSCSHYLEDCLLSRLDRPLLIALDEMNVLFNYGDIASEFLPLLRSWYEDACELVPWQNLRWAIARNCDFCPPLPWGQFPLDVGLTLTPQDFTPEQVQLLSLCHGLTWAEDPEQIAPLITLLGGQPSLVRLALYHLTQGEVTLAQLIHQALHPLGIYSQHLRQCLGTIAPHPDLKASLYQVVTSHCPIELDPIVAYQLESLGLIRLIDGGAIPRCDLYRRYFSAQGFATVA